VIKITWRCSKYVFALFRVFLSCLFGYFLDSVSSMWQYCCFFFQYQWVLLTPKTHCANSHRYPVMWNTKVFIFITCFPYTDLSPAWEQRQIETTEDNAFFGYCSTSALPFFCWRLRHSLLSSEYCIEKQLKLTVQLWKWLYYFIKLKILFSPALDIRPTFFFIPTIFFLFCLPFLPHTFKQFSGSQVHCSFLHVRYLDPIFSPICMSLIKSEHLA